MKKEMMMIIIFSPTMRVTFLTARNLKILTLMRLLLTYKFKIHTDDHEKDFSFIL